MFRRLAAESRYPSFVRSAVVAAVLGLIADTAGAESLERVLERLDKLEAENRQLRAEIEALKAERIKPPQESASPSNPDAETSAARVVRTNSSLAYDLLDPTTGINRKQRRILERRKDGTLAPDSLHVHGAVTAIANHQTSNRSDNFGYLMRHPTAKNQVGDTVSEATIHSAQLGFTGTLGDWVTGHAAMLFDPEQSFGDGTNTDIDRNQLQMRRAYVLFGDLHKSPFYASLGKMAVPFGLTDTVNPFSASTIWHVFGGLANGVIVGYANDGLSLSVMGIQGGAQYRAANTPVKGTAVPGRLNNVAADANYSFGLGQAATLLLGGSYQHGTAFCQGLPHRPLRRLRGEQPRLRPLRQARLRRSDVQGGIRPNHGGVARHLQPRHAAIRGQQGDELRHRRPVQARHGRGPGGLVRGVQPFGGRPWRRAMGTAGPVRPGCRMVRPAQREAVCGIHPYGRLYALELHQRRQCQGRTRRGRPRSNPQR